MSDELLINVSPGETRVALVENGLLQEVHIERNTNRSVVGNIYRGKVSRVLPGMQAAFVDIGLQRSAFLHIHDIEKNESQTNILQAVRPGQTLLVQVMKAPLGDKGARLTTQLSLSSRYLVYMPSDIHIGVSQRIEDEIERERLRELVEGLVSELQLRGGFIVRTVAEGSNEKELRDDIHYLLKCWDDLQRELPNRPVPGLVYCDLPLAIRALRDIASTAIEKIRVDSVEWYEKAKSFSATYSPELGSCIHCYNGPRPLFDLYSVEDEINKALAPVVQLKSGGHLVIEQTEAMTTVDVNTGTYVGHKNQEETIFKTNLEAATVLARQLRVRNIGGIVIVDFIDMQSSEHRRQVLRAFERALEKDRAKKVVNELSSLGLVEMTRKRTSESLGRLLNQSCPACDGTGQVKSIETLGFEILREIIRVCRQYEGDRILVLASEVVADHLGEQGSELLLELEDLVQCAVEIRVETGYSTDQYDIIPV